MKKILLISASATLLVLAFFFFLRPLPTKADFNANNLIDDYTFDNVNTMNEAQINAFLNTFPGSCISQNNGFSSPDVTGYSPGTGYTYGGNVTAGAVIAHAAQAYNINPQVLLATLQKEQSLVTGGSSICNDPHSLSAAMGYDCPDSGNCPRNPATESGFSKQVIHAAWLLKFGEQRSEGNVGWSIVKGGWINTDDPSTCYGGPMTGGTWHRCSGDTAVFYDGYTTIDGTSVHLDSGATAALYWYTPHFHGNQNFETIFQTWFGPTTGQGFQLVIADNCLSGCPQYVVYDGVKQHIPDSQTLIAWGLQNVTLTTMPAAQLAAIHTNPDLNRLMILQGTSTMYFVDGGHRYKIPWNSMLATWNFTGQTVNFVSPALFSLPTDNGTLTNAIKDPGSATLYMLDGANTGGQVVLRPYQNTATFQTWEGDSAGYVSISSDYFATINSAIGATLTGTKASYGGQEFQVMGGQWLAETPTIGSMYPGSVQAVSGATFNRLVSDGSIGAMVQVPGNPTVYMVDGGTKHQMLWPNALLSWEPAGQPVTQVSSSYLNLLSTGTSIGGYVASNGGLVYVLDSGTKTAVPSSLTTTYSNISGSPFAASSALMSLYPAQPNQATGFVRGINEPSVYLLDNSSQKRHLEWADKVTLWGGYQAGITLFSNYIVDNMSEAASPSIFVSDGTTNYVMEGGKKWTVSSGIQTDWGLSNPQVISDGTLARYLTGGALDNKLADGHGAYFLIRGGSAYGTVDSNIAGVWGIANAPVHDSALIRAQINSFALTRFARSSVQGDNRVFAIDNGQWYSLTSAQLSNMVWGNEPIMLLNPSYAPGSIAAWPGVIVKDSQNNFYVLDGGGKRYFDNSVIFNQWTNFGTTSTITVSNSFLGLIPTRGDIQRTIKGSGPSVYSAENGVKRHILYSNTYNTLYAPYIPITDTLLNAMPTGPDIN